MEKGKSRNQRPYTEEDHTALSDTTTDNPSLSAPTALGLFSGRGPIVLLFLNPVTPRKHCQAKQLRIPCFLTD